MATLLYNSHYPVPWIIWKRAYSVSVAGNGAMITQSITHGLPFMPLLIGQWSTNPNFSPSYDISVTIPGGGSGGQPETYVGVSATATTVDFQILNNSTSSRTYYFRLMAFAPPNYANDVTPVEYSSPFRFNSKYRYQQLYLSGSASAGATITHGLGYLPQAKVWAISSVRVMPSPGILTTNLLRCAADSSDYYYHIYKDPIE